MPFAAVISASAAIGDDDRSLRATLVFAGQTLVEYQARQAAEAGAGHISIHVSAVTPALSRSVDRLIADGINVSLVRSPSELRQTVPVGTDILLVGDGIVARQSWYEELAAQKAPALLVVNDHPTQPQFERIDARHRWAGLARLDHRQLLDTVETLDLLADWDLQSTLLRHAVQVGGNRIAVSDEALFAGEVVQLESQEAADAAERDFLPTQARESSARGWVEDYVLGPVGDRLLPVLLRQQIEPRPLRISGAAIGAIGLVVAANGLTWPALLIFLLALGTERLADGVARTARRTGRAGWSGYLSSALALLGLAVLGSSWRIGTVSAEFTGLYLACSILIVELAIRGERMRGMNPWLVCSLPTAVLLLLLFRFAGALSLGFAFVILYALGTLAVAILGDDSMKEGVTASK